MRGVEEKEQEVEVAMEGEVMVQQEAGGLAEEEMEEQEVEGRELVGVATGKARWEVAKEMESELLVVVRLARVVGVTVEMEEWVVVEEVVEMEVWVVEEEVVEMEALVVGAWEEAA